jgi:hypothetical protein
MRHRDISLTVLLLAACGTPASNQQAAANASGETPNAPVQADAGQLTIQPGQWEVTTSVSSVRATRLPPGVTMPQMPTTTVRTCVTPAQAREAAASFAGRSDRHGMNCDYSGVSIANGRIQGRSTCSREGMTATVTMDGTFTPTSYDIQQQMQASIRGRESSSTNHLVGRRVGECTAEQLRGSEGAPTPPAAGG